MGRSGASGGGDYIAIADVIVAGADATLDFNVIPQTFRHLFVVWSGRLSIVAALDVVMVQLNNLANGAQAFQRIRFNAAAVGADESIGGALNIAVGRCAGSTATAGRIGSGTIWLPDYARTTFRHNVHGLSIDNFGDAANSQQGVFGGGEWADALAITAVSVRGQLAPSTFQIGSRATLYGLK